MARPSRRGPSRRGGSYSSQRAPNQRSTAGGNPRQNDGRGSYGGGRGRGDNDQMPIYIGLGIGAVVLIGALIFLLSGGSGDDVTPVVQNNQPEDRPTQPAVVNPDASDVLLPFSSAEKERIRAKIEKLDEDYDEAKDLKDQGFLAHNKQDYEDAQAAWKGAQRLLDKMDNGSNSLELEFGDDVWERLEQFMPTVNRTIQRWGKLRREFTKYLK